MGGYHVYAARNMQNKRGFSLVELAIVLVILGLLAGGVLSGQSLIRAAELRSVSTDLSRYQVALQSFRDKYMAIPGDMNNATAFWGKNTTDCNGDPGSAGTPGTCNGNGNGTIEAAAAPRATAEMFQLWKQLALAGLVEGTYTGLADSVSAQHSVIGSNVPRSKISNTGVTLIYWDYSAGTTDTTNYAMNYGNHMMFGGASVSTGTNSPFLKPEETWNIDTKLDDGKPGTGKLIAIYWQDCTLSTTLTDFDKDYKLTEDKKVCAIRYKDII